MTTMNHHHDPILILGGTGKTVSRALGRQARDFADYARQTAAAGIWGGNK
ncbi:hypothetical protein [Phyllobacterium phragmitis]|nr:hypothetical protein [Phyllobacterium phragmitis]